MKRRRTRKAWYTFHFIGAFTVSQGRRLIGRPRAGRRFKTDQEILIFHKEKRKKTIVYIALYGYILISYGRRDIGLLRTK